MGNNPIILILKREFKRILERKTLYYLIILIPIILFFYYPYIYKSGVLREIPIVICDNDNSQLSHLIIKYVESSTSLRIVDYVVDQREIEKKLKSNNIYAGLLIPKNFSNDLKKGKSSTIIVFNNSTNLITSNIIYKEANIIVKTISGGVLLKKLRSAGLMSEQSTNIINMIKIDSSPLFNPRYNYLEYLVIGLIPALIQMIIMVSGSLILSSEYSHNTFSELYELSNHNIFNIIIGKSIPHLVLHSINIIFVLCVIFPLYKIGMNGSLFYTIIFSLLFISVSFFFSFFISSLIQDQQFATEVVIFINTPAFIFSGYIFPLWAMPNTHSMLANLVPFTHYISGFIKLFVMNTNLSNVFPEFLILFLMLVIFIMSSIVVLKIKSKNFVEMSS